MNVLTTASGAVRKNTRIFVTQKDVSSLMGCGKSKAYAIVREINKLAKKNGSHPFPAGKANKYLFSDTYGIPIEEVDKVINEE